MGSIYFETILNDFIYDKYAGKISKQFYFK